ncbi:MAG: rRNA cytosine-C5-methyltransferase [Paludibacter sp.]|nr:rRNA cytosine-C5-methyltransferase [Paludibacter sp.]
MTQLPADFAERTKKILKDEYDAFVAALQTSAPTSIRTNNKTHQLPQGSAITWCPNGLYLPERPLFTADPLFHGGDYYVQEASSMFLYQAVQQTMNNATKVLDLCAAPGGKSTLLTQYLPNNCLLISNEVIRQRSQILAENVTKWGNNNVVVTNNEPADFGELTHFFDAIVVDAPCSGEGMFRKDANAINEWSIANVHTCVDRQRRILTDVWDALKPNGILVYSTCTFNTEENEENVTWACNELGAKIIKLKVDDTNIVQTEEGYRFYPHKIKGEGFFMAVMQKSDNIIATKNLKVKPDKNIKAIEADTLPIKLKEPENYRYYETENTITAFNASELNTLLYLRKNFNCLIAGTDIFEVKGKDLIPTEFLALSKNLDISSCKCIDVDLSTAIAYLKREAINLPETEKGYLLITYKNLPLGWVKNIGNRCNNLYPQHWRIRMNLQV